MAVERFYSGDPLSASRFNRLVATVCNLRRKVAEIKRRPKANLLRNEWFARYPYACRACVGCGGFVSCFCYKPCVGVFPIYKPPFSMHWKMSEWECNGRYYSTETTTLVVNRGSWFKGSKRVDFPKMEFDNAPCGEYFVCWSGAVVMGVRNATCLLPKGVFPIGRISSGLVVENWSGDIWQPPEDCSIYVQGFADYERFWSNQIFEDCRANTCTKNCVFRPARAEFTRTNVSSIPCVCSYLSLAGGYSTPDARWIHGSQRAGLETNLPTLCVNIHGRCSGHPASCFYWYSGNPVYVCKKCLRNYTYGISPDGVTNGVLGYSRINDYTSEHYACRWIDTPLLPVQNVLSVWTAEVLRGGACACGYGVGDWQPDRCLLVMRCGVTESSATTEAGSWKFVSYIANIVACKKKSADTVYSIPKKQSISETYYTGENCNGD